MRHAIALFVLLAGPAFAAPADKSSQHSLGLPGGAFPITAVVETQILETPDGKPAAEIVTTAFLHDPAPGAMRPVTFAFNGGPGAGSAWLDLGAIGPWRVPLDIPVVPSQDPTPVDNADTWLPFTDLVFIDPPGTGYSRWSDTGPDGGKAFLNVDGDIATLATVARRWLEAHGRLGAPVFIAGESYGGFRAPRLARALLQQQGIGVSGLLMISPVLDFNNRDGNYDPLHAAVVLPSLAAAHRNASSRDNVADIEAYAAGDYLRDLLRGPNDAAALERIVTTLAPATGLDPSLLRRLHGRVDWTAMLADRVPGQVASPYDLNLSTPDPLPESRFARIPDSALDGLRGPLTAAMLTVYRRIGWQPEGAPNRVYVLLSESLNRRWEYGSRNNRPESMTALREFLTLDPSASALVIHGLYDVVTPYFADALLVAQVPETTPPGRLTLHAYAGGHMFYTNSASRHALQQDARTLIERAVASKPPH